MACATLLRRHATPQAGHDSWGNPGIDAARYQIVKPWSPHPSDFKAYSRFLYLSDNEIFGSKKIIHPHLSCQPETEFSTCQRRQIPMKTVSYPGGLGPA
jgi:hypothetical protein